MEKHRHPPEKRRKRSAIDVLKARFASATRDPPTTASPHRPLQSRPRSVRRRPDISSKLPAPLFFSIAGEPHLHTPKFHHSPTTRSIRDYVFSDADPWWSHVRRASQLSGVARQFWCTTRKVWCPMRQAWCTTRQLWCLTMQLWLQRGNFGARRNNFGAG
jgi:hypothetical protein